ncbi:hypothetical protein ES695_02330, partial [Candidatus Atribacteria bacterium 1244-E10-H5-B2]
MAKNKKKRSKSKHRGRTVKSRKIQDKNLLPNKRWPEGTKTGEFSFSDQTVQEYQRNIIQFVEKEIYLPEKKEQL